MRAVHLPRCRAPAGPHRGLQALTEEGAGLLTEVSLPGATYIPFSALCSPAARRTVCAGDCFPFLQKRRSFKAPQALSQPHCHLLCCLGLG